MDENRPFRGSWARNTQGWTWGDLRGPRVRPLFRDVYVSATAHVDLVVRARAALIVHPAGVVGGVAAAAVWGSAYGAVDTEVDVHPGPAGGRSQQGLHARREHLRVDEQASVDGVRVTTPARTVFDLARRLPLVEAVAAIDALSRVAPVLLEDVRATVAHHPGARGVRSVERVLGLVDRRSSSPVWSRARVALLLRGIEVPAVGHWVADPEGRPAAQVELAWPDSRYGVSSAWKGPPVPARDPGGWTVERVDPAEAVEHPDRFATGVARGLWQARYRIGREMSHRALRGSTGR